MDWESLLVVRVLSGLCGDILSVAIPAMGCYRCPVLQLYYLFAVGRIVFCLHWANSQELAGFCRS